MDKIQDKHSKKPIKTKFVFSFGGYIIIISSNLKEKYARGGDQAGEGWDIIMHSTLRHCLPQYIILKQR